MSFFIQSSVGWKPDSTPTMTRLRPARRAFSNSGSSSRQAWSARIVAVQAVRSPRRSSSSQIASTREASVKNVSSWNAISSAPCRLCSASISSPTLSGESPVHLLL